MTLLRRIVAHRLRANSPGGSCLICYLKRLG